MDRSPPPFFKQGPSANARLAFFAVLAITLLVIDARAHLLAPLRQGIGTVLYPLQRALLVPRDIISQGGDYFVDITKMRKEVGELRRIEAVNARALLQAEQLAAENAQLRRLLGMREQLAIRSAVAEVLYETRDPFTRRLVLDKGLQHGVLAGQPVVDAEGVVGQISRVTTWSSELTLLTDRQSTIPIALRRTGQRSVAFGGPRAGQLEIRYLPPNTDLRPGDMVETSGLDSLYPAGLPVGRIVEFEPSGPNSFSSASMEPVAGIERSKLLLILLIDKSMLPEIPDELVGPTKKRGKGRR
ncbi:MAG: rod shape-determining protein MreC [Burkholderiaceae bacterium]|nr:rod shape-determining protein MreC [Burkholderiaceae bacterium]